jgi:hypothetical protein
VLFVTTGALILVEIVSGENLQRCRVNKNESLETKTEKDMLGKEVNSPQTMGLLI